MVTHRQLTATLAVRARAQKAFLLKEEFLFDGTDLESRESQLHTGDAPHSFVFSQPIRTLALQHRCKRTWTHMHGVSSGQQV